MSIEDDDRSDSDVSEEEQEDDDDLQEDDDEIEMDSDEEVRLMKTLAKTINYSVLFAFSFKKRLRLD